MDTRTSVQMGLLLCGLSCLVPAGWYLFGEQLRQNAGGALLLVGAVLIIAGSLNFQGIFLWPGAILLALAEGILLPEWSRYGIE
jgi:hypothetical protein